MNKTMTTAEKIDLLGKVAWWHGVDATVHVARVALGELGSYVDGNDRRWTQPDAEAECLAIVEEMGVEDLQRQLADAGHRDRASR